MNRKIAEELLSPDTGFPGEGTIVSFLKRGKRIPLGGSRQGFSV